MSRQPPPFAQWLGRERFVAWADYYELLAVSRETDDPQAIATVAEDLISRVAACDPGEHRPAWEKLLEQLQAAKECLTNPAQRTAYDRRIQSAGERIPEAIPLSEPEPGPHLPGVAPPPVALTAAPPLFSPNAPGTRSPPQPGQPTTPSAARLQTVSHAHALRRRRRHSRARFWVFTLLGVSTLATTVGLSYFVLRGRWSRDEVRAEADVASVAAGGNAGHYAPPVTADHPRATGGADELAASGTDQRLTRPGDAGQLGAGRETGRAVAAPARETPPARTAELNEITPQQALLLSQELQSLKAALARQDVKTARRHLEAAQKIAAGTRAAAVVSRWSVLTHYVAEFWSAVHHQLQSLHAGEEIVIDDRVSVFVERRDDHTIILRSSGQNRPVRIRPLPPKLALALARAWLDESLVSTPLICGAFLAVDPAPPEDARREWRRAESRGEDVAELTKTLEDQLTPEALQAR